MIFFHNHYHKDAMEDDHTHTSTHPRGELPNLESNAQKPKEFIEKIQFDTLQDWSTLNGMSNRRLRQLINWSSLHNF